MITVGIKSPRCKLVPGDEGARGTLAKQGAFVLRTGSSSWLTSFPVQNTTWPLGGGVGKPKTQGRRTQEPDSPVILRSQQTSL